MKFNIIHQPHRSGKTTYIVRKAYENLVTSKSTLIFTTDEKEFMSRMINYLNKKKVQYYLVCGNIFLKNGDYGKLELPHISISNNEELKFVYEERRTLDREFIKDMKEDFHNVFFDNVHNNFFKRANDIYKMLDVICRMKNIPEVRFTYKISPEVILNKKPLELKQLKRLLIQDGVSYKEIQSDTKLDNNYNNNIVIKKYHGYEINPLQYEVEVIGKLLNTIVVKCDMDRREELLKIIALSDREDEIHNAMEELRDMEV